MTPKEVLAFVKLHGVVLQAAHGPVPSLAETIAGGRIRGSWWGHPKGREIFSAAATIADHSDVLVCKLIEGKVTYIHRRLWPALVKLADRFRKDQLARVRDEHTASGAHRSRSEPFPDWVPADAVREAEAMSVAGAETILAAWLGFGGGRRRSGVNRTAHRIALFVLLSWTLACAARSPKQPDAAASGPGVRWPIPNGWKHETFALPPEFAPTLPYHGSEDLRFMPGFSSPAAPDFWSYDLVWWLDQSPPFDAPSVAATLTTYFQGLATAVGGSKYQFDPSRFHVVLAPVPASEPPRLTGQVFTYDPFVTGLPITLNVEAVLRSCPGTKQVAVVVALSPKDTTDSVWKALRTTAGTLVCN